MSIRPGLLAALLKAGHLHGAIRWKVDIDSGVAEQEIAMAGASQVVLDTTGVKTLDEFFAVFTQQVQGESAAHVDLSNFESVLAAHGANTALLWTGWQEFVKHAPADASVVADILDSASSQWPGVVLVLGKQGAFPNVGELTSIS
jgi:hypothetical protein